MRDRGAGLARGLPGGLGASVPVAVGYLPAGFAFGVAARQTGLVPTEATPMSLVIYSGSSQFALLGLLTAGASWAVMLVIPLVLSLRHLLYGPTLAPRLRGIGTWRAAFVAFGLDEFGGPASIRTEAAHYRSALGCGFFGRRP